ncbi:MAG: hypothetical protein GTO41_04505 [Burkholderiales bacterium]|nr:hypothetical protein [Burkholderiales bacterium]
MAGGIVSHPAVRDRVPDADDWGIVSRVIGGGGFLIVDQLRPAFSTVTALPQSVVAATALVATAARRGAFFYNNASSRVFIKLGAGVSATSFTTSFTRNGFYEVQWPTYTGIITAVWATPGGGDLQITELS